MLDFGGVPPEVISGWIYLGPGSGPMTAAAAGWDAVSAVVSTVAARYGSVLAELTDSGWLGPASTAMATAAAPYLAWLQQTADEAARAADQARAAAAAYEVAFAMTVPPPVIAANRSLWLTLVMTNFFGQNAAAIAAADAHYAEMWVQDTTAMDTYAAASAAANTLSPFTEPPQTTSPAGAQSASVVQAVGTAAQHVGTAQSSATAPGVLQAASTDSLLSSPFIEILEHVPNVTNTVLSTSNAVTSGRGIFIQYQRFAAQEAVDLPPGDGHTGGPRAPVRLVSYGVSARLSGAPRVGSVSVPAGWVTAAPEIQATAPSSTAPGITAAPAGAGPAPPGNVFSQSVLGTLSRHPTSTPKQKSKPIIVRSPAAG